MSSRGPDSPLWAEADGPDADIVITTRARLARSLASYPFPSAASREDLSRVARDVRRASTLLTERFPRLRAFRVEKLTIEQRSYLIDTHLASVEQARAGAGRFVIADPSGRLFIMVNEEDHLRLQCLESGLNPEIAWETVDWADDVLSASLDYGFSRELGYLTANVSNLGTGLRVSALVHLAGLSAMGSLRTVLKAAWDLGVSIRGLFGEGSQAVGDLVQVSNEVTLGFTEMEIVQKVRSVAEYLLSAERAARKELLETRRAWLTDTVRKSLMTMQGAMSLRAKEAVVHLSPLRLAVSLGLLRGSSMQTMNEMLMAVRAGAGDDISVRLQRGSASRNKMARTLLADE